MNFQLVVGQVVFLGFLSAAGTAASAPFPVVDVTCLQDPSCQLEESVKRRTGKDGIAATTSDYAKPHVFLLKHQRRFVGIPMGAGDVSEIVDLSEAPEGSSDPYWDAYQIGAYYTAYGSQVRGGDQIWHVRFGAQEHKQLTDGNCIPGVGPVTRNWACDYLAPIAAVPGRLAYIQRVSIAVDSEGNKGAPETPQWQVVAVVNGSASGIISLDRKPDHLSWSPDGKWLVFVDGGELLAISETGKVCVLPKVETTQVRHPEWTDAGGGMIVYETAGDIWMVPVKTTGPPNRCPELRVNKKVQLTTGGDQDKDPQWMETNNFIAFTSNRPLNPEDTSRQNRIWVGQVGGGEAMELGILMPFGISYADWQIYLK